MNNTAGFDRTRIFMRECTEEPKNVMGYGRPPAPPPRASDETVDAMRVIRDRLVTMRDGVRIYVDIYLPEGAGGDAVLGTLVGWAAFGKHNTSATLPANTGLPDGSISRHTGFELPDPVYWTAAGYAVIYPDPRGSWNSEGDYFQGGTEIEDAYDLCEWAGVQPWSNGKVAFTGVSYPATIAWQLAALRPPHLAAIMPWEGFTDMYREFAYHGGIRETGHTRLVGKVMGWPGRLSEDLTRNYDSHPFDDAFWAFKNPIIENIDVPAYVCASWTDQGLHGRGTLEGWKRLKPGQKWLQVHGRQKWAEYYRPENIARQRMFFDRFLLDKNTGIERRPPVEIEVRERAFSGEIRAEQEWPLARATHQPMFLDASCARLLPLPAQVVTDASYDPIEGGELTFDHRFDTDTEITGHIALKLWVEARGSNDMDLFVAIQKLDASGQLVGFPYFAFHVDGPVALGWLRVSHRELDTERSRPGQPVHAHRREQLLKPGEVVAADIEVWASSTLFRAGETLRLLIKGSDIYVYEEEHTQGSHLALRNAGRHVVHTGGVFDSHLLLPIAASA